MNFHVKNLPPAEALVVPGAQRLITGAEAQAITAKTAARRERGAAPARHAPQTRFNRKPRPGEPATAADIARELRIVDGHALLPRESISRLFNIPKEHVRERLQLIGINHQDSRFLDRGEVTNLSRSLYENPDIEVKSISCDDKYNHSSRAIRISEIADGFSAFSVVNGIGEKHKERRRPEHSMAYESAEEKCFPMRPEEAPRCS